MGRGSWCSGPGDKSPCCLVVSSDFPKTMDLPSGVQVGSDSDLSALPGTSNSGLPLRRRKQADFPGTVELHIQEYDLGTVRRPTRFIRSHRRQRELHLFASIQSTSPQSHVGIGNVGHPLPIERKIDWAGGETLRDRNRSRRACRS